MDLVGGFAALCRCGKKLCEHPGSAASTRVVLPETSEPLSYDVHLTLRLEDHAFDGVVLIDVQVKAPLKELTVHSKELAISSAFFGAQKATSISYDAAATTATFTFNEALPVGSGVLRVEYAGMLNDLMCGFYRSTYTDAKGEKKLMASTQFESIDARRCLPCWDEPLRKAPFTCKLTVPVHLTALSNMPESSSTTHQDGTKTVAFMPTPRMSTYLLAFVVGEFDHVSALTKSGVLVRAFVPPGKPELGRFALLCAVDALDAYDAAFQIPYPLPKSDMVAIPEFAAGAMENWGLVTYREVDMLIDAAASSKQLQRVAEVVIHELAHQWFGNLVTMEWWSDLWLNEGFATWMETSVCAHLHPDWAMWEQFITDMQGHALQLDALRSSHPIQVPIAHAEEVEQVFDAISYCKGGAVVRMARAVVGEEAFMGGLRAYFKQFAYGNANTADLWAAWAKASGMSTFSEMMDVWTTQVGFPLLEVVSFEGGKVELKQSRFFADGAVDEDQALWTIPLFVATAETPVVSEEALVALMPRSATFSFPQPAAAWIKLNAGQHAPLRCKYPDAMYGALADALKSGALKAADRIGLISDAAALARAGLLRVELYFELLFACQRENDATVWSMVLSQLLNFSKVLRGGSDALAPMRDAFDALAKQMVAPQLAHLGWEPRATDAHLTRKLRGEVVSSLPTLCAGDADVQKEARRRFDLFVAGDASAVPAEYQSAVYKLVLAAGGEAEFDAVFKLFEQLPLNEEKKNALVGLGAAPTAALRARALDLALSPAVKLQDFFYVAMSMHGSSAAGRDATWAHYREHFDAYKAKVGDASSGMMEAAIVGACSGFSSKEKANEITAFFSANQLPRCDRKIAQTVEAIETSAKYLDKLDSRVLAFLQETKLA
ncbi:peptidase family M1-domain-containing protein [Pelagophyceae sp. CCMP2097]|nr:peptidase family M1-domain-containing protein [Pelagophyceae sp. CCMP2097]|mmetsp:Transcript_20781/g.70427  ORF Transcript_20781/g.70427 Transcript_20781/m.70427 type:complete len:892 (+) Transcript_20781:68-2743(+)